MISRRHFLEGVAVGALAAPPAGWAQQAKTRMHRIGFLGAGSASGFANHIAGLRAGLREQGYEEPKNISIEFRWAEGNLTRLPGFASELVRLRIDLIVTQGSPATLAAKEATTSIPIVMAAVGDAIVTGVVASLARPGGNITGLTFFAPQIGAKRLELLKQAMPHVNRVAVPYNPDNPIQRGPVLDTFRVTASSLKLDLDLVEIRARDQFANVFSDMARRRIDAVLFSEEPILVINAKALGDLAAKYRLASIGPLEFLPAGCMMAYGVNFPELYRRAAVFVARILEGAKPADLPVEQATRFEFIVNLKSAKALGLSIAPAVLQRADRVIE